MNLNNLPYFVFNGQKSTDLGIIIKEMPPITKSEKDIDIITINGRNGNLHIDNGTYKAKTYKIKCVLADESKINDIKMLLDSDGTLEISSELGIEYSAVVKNQIDFAKYLSYLKEFTINFELYPVGYSKTVNSYEFTDAINNFEVGGTFNVPPVLIVAGIGIVTLNNIQFEVLEDGITIDCDLMNCTLNNINKNDKVVLDEFPTLIVGQNTLVLGQGITSVTVTYKEGWL